MILDKLERGISGRKLAVEFKVHHSTISKIKKRKKNKFSHYGMQIVLKIVNAKLRKRST